MPVANTVYSTPPRKTSVVVVSPFVGQDADTKPKASVLKSLSDVTFLQNQAITRGTSLLSTPVQVAGGAIIASSSKPRNTGYRSHLQRRDSSGKRTFQSYEWRGRRYDKPLNTRRAGPMGKAYGYNTDYKSKSGVKGKKPGRMRSRTGRAAGIGIVGFGKALPTIGVGLAAYNVVRSPKQAAQDSADYGFFGLPTNPERMGEAGMANDLVNLPGRISNKVTKPKTIGQALLIRSIIGGIS